VSREGGATRYAVLGLRYGVGLVNITKCGREDLLHNGNYWAGLLVCLDFDKPAHFNPMAGSPIEGEDRLEIRRRRSQWNNPGLCRDNPRKLGS